MSTSGFDIGSLGDLVTTTLKSYKRDFTVDAASTLQTYPFAKEIMSENRIGYDDGIGPSWEVTTQQNNSAWHPGVYAEDRVPIPDTQIEAYMPWRFTTASQGFDEKENAFNKGTSAIVKLVKTRRAAMDISLCEKIEDFGWQCPAESDKYTPPGIPYFVVKWPTGTTTPGFTGSFAFGGGAVYTAGPAGINPTTYPRTRNYAGKYTNVTKTDLVAKMRKMAELTNWKSPTDKLSEGKRGNCKAYTTYDVLAILETIAEQQNENLGFSIDPADGAVMFRSNLIQWVPWLQENDNAAGPMYFINWGTMKNCFKTGQYMKETGPIRSDKAHTVFSIFVDNTHTLECHNRRTCGVLSVTAKGGESS